VRSWHRQTSVSGSLGLNTVLDFRLKLDGERSARWCDFIRIANMAWLHEQFDDFALGVALIYGGTMFLGLVRQTWQDPRTMGARLCGVTAWFFALLAILWAAHLADKYL
jgi:hypothetical protein